VPLDQLRRAGRRGMDQLQRLNLRVGGLIGAAGGDVDAEQIPCRIAEHALGRGVDLQDGARDSVVHEDGIVDAIEDRRRGVQSWRSAFATSALWRPDGGQQPSEPQPADRKIR
jgi:hypothetical protein